MKQIVLLLCLCIAGIANAGNKSKKTDINAITFYGVNFSLAKVYARLTMQNYSSKATITSSRTKKSHLLSVNSTRVLTGATGLFSLPDY